VHAHRRTPRRTLSHRRGGSWLCPASRLPDYTATDEDWTDSADDSRVRSGIGAFLVLLAGIALLHFAATIRSVLGGAETTAPGSLQLFDGEHELRVEATGPAPTSAISEAGA
jgi:hypothetical protein